MRNTAESVQRGRRLGTSRSLPRITVDSRADVGEVLLESGWRLEERALQLLGDPEAAQEALRLTKLNLLAVENPHQTHALRWMLLTLRNECREVKQRRERLELAKQRARAAGAPVDPILRELIGAKAEAVRSLPAAERDVLTLAAEGLKPKEIGALLGLSAKAVSQRLWRGRSHVLAAVGEREDAGPGLSLIALPLVGRPGLKWLADRTTAVSRALVASPRSTVDRLAALVANLDLAQVAATTAVLAVMGASWSPSRPATPASPTNPQVTAPAVASLDGPVAEQRGTSSAWVGHFFASSAIPGPVRSKVSPPERAAAETPQDSQLVSAAQAPSAGREGTVVALGIGHTCGCWDLFQTVDAGRTWAEAAAPTSGQQVALPARYPDDPRIFVGSSTSSGSPVLMAERFGAEFQSISSLLPPGHVSLSAGFDAGDPRIFVAGSSGVLSYVIGAAVAPTPLVLYSPSEAPAALATPTGNPSVAVVMAVPATAEVMGQPVGAAAGIPSGYPQYVSCGRSAGCAVMSSIPLPNVLDLSVSGPPVGETILAWGSAGVARSTDGGASFDLTPALGATSVLVSAAQAGPTTWAVTLVGQAARVERIGAGEASWTDVTMRVGLQGRGQFLALNSVRLLYLPVGQGFFCSEDGGATWARGCL